MQKLFQKVMSKGKKSSATSAIVQCNNYEPIQLDKSGNVTIRILAKPGAKHNGITNISSEGVAVQIAAPPSEGEANAELLKYFSKILNLRKSDITLEKGSRSRHKMLLISKGISTPAIIEELVRKEIES